jgi:uncharacterized membrane protein YqjE
MAVVATAPTAAADPAGVNLLDAVRILRSAGGALSVQALLHGQLARIELEEEKNRLLKMLAATLLGFACLLCVLLFAGALVLAATWETRFRIEACAGLVILYGIGTAAAWRYFQDWSAQSNQTFAASREELAADAALLKNSL